MNWESPVVSLSLKKRFSFNTSYPFPGGLKVDLLSFSNRKLSSSAFYALARIDFSLVQAQTISLPDGWTTTDLIYKWKKQDPVQVVPDLNLPRFKLEKFSTDYCNSKTNTGNHLNAKISLDLHATFSLQQIQANTVVWRCNWFSSVNFRIICWPFTCPLVCWWLCHGSPSGWIQNQCPRGSRLEWQLY